MIKGLYKYILLDLIWRNMNLGTLMTMSTDSDSKTFPIHGLISEKCSMMEVPKLIHGECVSKLAASDV